MKLDPDKLLRFVTLRPRKKTEEEKKYGTFNRRMIAASLDLFLISIVISPLVDYAFVHHYGPAQVSMQELQAKVAGEADSGSAVRKLYQEMQESGFLDRWKENMRWEIYVVSVYLTLCWYLWAATPGKMLCRLKIVDAKTGGPMKDWQSIVRLLGYFVSAIPFGIGFFWIGLNRQRRGWHDLLAGTSVIALPLIPKWKKPTSAPLSDHPSNSPEPSAAE